MQWDGAEDEQAWKTIYHAVFAFCFCDSCHDSMWVKIIFGFTQKRDRKTIHSSWSWNKDHLSFVYFIQSHHLFFFPTYKRTYEGMKSVDRADWESGLCEQLWEILTWRHELNSTYWTIILACQRRNWVQEQKINLCKQYVETCPPCHLFVYLSYGRRFLDTRKDTENTPDSRECAREELSGARACVRVLIVCIVCVCVCSLTLWCQPLRSLPALARHDPSVTFLLPSLLPSLPHPPHSVHPSLCVSSFFSVPPVSLFTSIPPALSVRSFLKSPRLCSLSLFALKKFLF